MCTVAETDRPCRNVSAEIFVVCRDFLAPKQIDPKFLDPKHVFKDLAMAAIPSAPTTTVPFSKNGEASTSAAAVVTNPGASGELAAVNIFAPEKKKRNRAGYADNDYTLYREIPVQNFVNASLTDAATILGTYNRMAFDVKDPVVAKWKESRHTTEEVLTNCSDLKVLGKGDFKRLLKWRLAIRLEVSPTECSRFVSLWSLTVIHDRSVSMPRSPRPKMPQRLPRLKKSTRRSS